MPAPWFLCYRSSCISVTEAFRRLVFRVESPVVLIGPPGVGKTMLARQAAEEYAQKRGLIFLDLTSNSRVSLPGCGGSLHDPSVRRCVVRRVEHDPERFMLFYRMVMSHVLPEDVLGIPRVDESISLAYYHKPLPLRLMSIDGVHGLLFLDEVTSIARPDVRSLLYAILDEKRVGDTVLSSNVRIAAAGNRLVDDSDVMGLPAPVINRCIVVQVAPPSIEEWRDYMDKKYSEWWRELAGVLRLAPSLFQGVTQENEKLGKLPFPSPRSWEKVAAEIVPWVCGYRLRGKCRKYAGAVVGNAAWSRAVQVVRDAKKMGINLEKLAAGDQDVLSIITVENLERYREYVVEVVAYEWAVHNREDVVEVLAKTLADMAAKTPDQVFAVITEMEKTAWSMMPRILEVMERLNVEGRILEELEYRVKRLAENGLEI